VAQVEFDGLNLVVRDMGATLSFYRLLGLDVPDDAIWNTPSGAHHVGIRVGGEPDVDLDSEQLAVRYNAGFSGDAAAGRTLVSFRTETREAVDETWSKLTAAGAKSLQEPYDAFFGARFAIVEDPDGRHVGLKSPADPNRRSAPPEI